jgi:teichuronic acid biosynthesis glycosyltransferase TuaC
MHVLLITNLYPNPQEPNRGIFTKQLVEKLRQIVEVTVMSPLPWFPKLEALRKFERWHRFAQVPEASLLDGWEVHYPKYIVIPKLFGFLQSVTLFLSLVTKIARLNRKKKIDVINAQWLYPDGVAATWAAKVLRIPVVVSALGCDVNLYASRLYPERRRQIKSTLRSAQHSIAISSAQKDLMAGDLGADPKRLSVVLNGVSQTQFRLQDRELCLRKFSLDPAKRYILYVGRLAEEKGTLPLLRAIHLLQRDGLDANVKLLMVGMGDLYAESLALVDRLDIKDRVLFMKERPYSQIVDWMGACTLLCLPSYREGCPNVVLEALACGRPVVASRVGSVPELLNDQNGFMAEPGDEESLAGALKKGLSAKWNAEHIRGSVQSYTWENMARRYKTIFEAAAAAKGPR